MPEPHLRLWSRHAWEVNRTAPLLAVALPAATGLLLAGATLALALSERLPPLTGWRSRRYTRLLETGSLLCLGFGLTAVATRRIGAAVLLSVAAVVLVLAGHRRRTTLIARRDDLRAQAGDTPRRRSR